MTGYSYVKLRLALHCAQILEVWTRNYEFPPFYDLKPENNGYVLILPFGIFLVFSFKCLHTMIQPWMMPQSNISSKSSCLPRILWYHSRLNESFFFTFPWNDNGFITKKWFFFNCHSPMSASDGMLMIKGCNIVIHQIYSKLFSNGNRKRYLERTFSSITKPLCSSNIMKTTWLQFCTRFSPVIANWFDFTTVNTQ